MRFYRTFLAATAACLVGLGSAHASQISGLLNISGTATFDKKSLGKATTVTPFTDVTVGGGNTGDFGSITVGTSVVMASPYIFSPSTNTPALWSVGGFTYDLQTSTVTLQNNNFLLISGTGMIFANGFEPTAGVWAFSTQNASGKRHDTFTFSANVEAVPGVPDGGMTVTLLGAALIGLGVLRATFWKA